MIISREVEDFYLIDFCYLEDYDDFDQIISILSNKFKVNILEKIDGPESRIWHLHLDEIEVTLINNPYGNTIKSKSNESKYFLEQNFDVIKAIFM